MDTLVTHTARRLNCQKTDTVKISIELYENFIRDNGLHLEIFLLQERLAREPLTSSLPKKILQTTKKIQEVVLQEELKCRKFKMGEVPWIRILLEIMYTILL